MLCQNINLIPKTVRLVHIIHILQHWRINENFSMLIQGPFILNGNEFMLDSLLEFAAAKLKDSSTPTWESDLYQFITRFFDEEQSLVQQTSGSTGEPKSIPLHRDAMLVSAQRTLDHFGLKDGDSALLCLPVQYIAGKMMVVRALLGGMNLVTVEPSGNLAGVLEELPYKVVNKVPDKIVEKVPDKDEEDSTGASPETGVPGPEGIIDFAAMVPLQVYELLKTPEIFNRIRKLIIGGGEIAPSMRKSIRTIKGTEIFETFAMSETYTHFATRRINLSGTEPEDSFQVMEGVHIRLDKRGCLVIDIPGVTDGPVTTNDLAEITGPRSFRWLGRLDNVIKTGGIKVIPETIEAVVKELTGREAVVLPVPDTRLGQKLLLVIEGEAETAGDQGTAGDQVKHSTDTELINALRQHFPKHEVPREVRYLPEFPRNRSMKVDRAAIRRALGID